MKKNFLLPFLLMGIMVISLSACKTDDKKDPDSTGAVTTEGGGSATGRTDINIPLDSIGNTMDVHAQTLRVDGIVTKQFAEPLYYVEDNGDLTPKLALSHTVSSDGLEYTFLLREGVKFHNGEDFKASDVLWNINRCIENLYRTTETEGIAKVEATDDHTVVFTLEEPSSIFVLNVSQILLVSEKVVTELGADYGTKVAGEGTGPYRMTKYDINNEIALEAFTDYWNEEASIKNIRFVPMSDASTQLIAFEKGDFDFCQIPTANWDDIEASGKFTTVKAPGIHISYLGVNVGKEGPLADAKVRQAIGYAINKEDMILIATDGFADVADYMLRPGFLSGAVDHGVFFTYDPEKSKALLKEAGYPDGFDLGVIEAINAANGRYINMAEVLQQNLADVGITSEILTGETASMLPAWKTDRKYDIFVSGFTPTLSYNDFKSYVYSTDDNQVQLSENAAIDTKFIDESFDKAIVELDDDKRSGLYSEVDQYLAMEAGYIPIMHVNSLYAWNKNLEADAPIRTYRIYDWYWK